MPSSSEKPARLDRLSALLLAAAPRAVMGVPYSTPPNALWIRLLPATSATPHSMEISQAGGVMADGVTLQVLMEGPAAPLLMREFSHPMVLSLAGADAALVHAVQLLCVETAAPRCGQPAMLASVGNMLFIGLLRHLVAHPQSNFGLFAGLGDPRMAAALVAMHEQPDAAWSLESLAGRATMSRTVFATRFKVTMGTPPGKYLAQLRLLIARRAVLAGQGLKGAARASGYRDTSALSRALGRGRLRLESGEQTKPAGA